ncbi:MAG: hypothetical protein ACLTJG_01690 [[Clostridium] innocuum]
MICFVCDDLVLPMEVAQDHKAAYAIKVQIPVVGAYSPVKKITPILLRKR